MKDTIKRLTLKKLRSKRRSYVTKDGRCIVRKKELIQMVCEAQLEKNGYNSESIISYLDSNGQMQFATRPTKREIELAKKNGETPKLNMCQGFYNVAFSEWIREGLITRSREDGYQLTDFGRLFCETDTRAYEIEYWKRKAKSEKFWKNHWKKRFMDKQLDYKDSQSLLGQTEEQLEFEKTKNWVLNGASLDKKNIQVIIDGHRYNLSKE